MVREARRRGPDRCMGCGICNSVCLSSSIAVDGLSDGAVAQRIAAQVRADGSRAPW